MQTVEEQILCLEGKDNQVAYACLRALLSLSETSSAVYAHWDALVALMDSDHSYRRARGLLLMAANARWDTDNRLDEVIDRYLTHVEDAKPITARQCIQSLPEVARYKPELTEDIEHALKNARVFRYPGTMQPLIQRDITNALRQIREFRADHPLGSES